MDQHGGHSFRPTIFCGDLAKPPAALRSLCTRDQWAIWRLTWRLERWTKPPFRADQPQRFARSNDPSSWSSYATAVAAAAEGDGITYMLTPEDEVAAVDIDHVRDPETGTIEAWAQQLLNQASHAYAEISPSGTGLRIWGTASGEPLHRKFSFADGTALGLFRRTRKPLTVTGLQIGLSRQLGNIDALLDRATRWAERRQHKHAKTKNGGNAGTAGRYGIDEIDRIVRDGAPDGTNRSDTFHSVVGHFVGCGWSVEQISLHLEQYPNGIGGRYIAEGRLAGEVKRSAAAFGIGDQQHAPIEEPAQETDEPALPPMYAHGDQDPQPFRQWAIKGLIPAQGHGLLSGQWGTYKSFMGLELAGCCMTGQPFAGHLVKRQSGVLFLAAEGQNEMRVRLEALVREKCGAMPRAPFRWFEDVPVLLQPDGLALLIAMGRKAAASLQEEFELPLGLLIIDTIAASAGFTGLGAENDTAITQRLMNVLKFAARELECFVLGIDHFGKAIASGTRGSSSKESSGDLVLACLGERELSGRMFNLRLAVRKCRAGRAGQEYPFTVREVQLLELDEDGEPITTLVIDWTAQERSAVQAPRDPWEESRKTETRLAMLLLKRVVITKLAQAGCELRLDPPVRGIDREIVREEFYAQTPVDGTEAQKQETRRKRFNRTLERACEKQLIGIREIGAITYLWLLPQQPSEDEF